MSGWRLPWRSCDAKVRRKALGHTSLGGDFPDRLLRGMLGTMSTDKWSEVRKATGRAAQKAASWALEETKEWNSRRPDRKAQREERQVASA